MASERIAMKKNVKSVKITFHTSKSANQNSDILLSKDTCTFGESDLIKIIVTKFQIPSGKEIRLSLVMQPAVSEPSSRANTNPETVSVSSELANEFHLKRYHDALIEVVNSKVYTVDFVEVTFKDQYFSRTDMMRIKERLTNTCVYLNKKIEFAGLRVLVAEIWRGGKRVSSGYVSETSRVAFRSYTAQVNIFIQMSSEMWTSDTNGYLYYERALDGFLTDLFDTWQDKHCNHDVTITLFSRVYYTNICSRAQLPPAMQECLQQNCDGEFFEDFYRVVVQNERYDDWTPVINTLRRIMKNYRSSIYKYYENSIKNTLLQKPVIVISNSIKGNVLEVLNMSLNVFEKYYLDRCLDRTGKVSIVVSPGAGLFDVCSELVRVTRQRTLDCGNCSDLVCLGQQPLHAVPLLRVRNFTRQSDYDYVVPNWINHSFYSTVVGTGRNKQFHPRISIPMLVNRQKGLHVPTESSLKNAENQSSATFYTIPTPLKRRQRICNGKGKFTRENYLDIGDEFFEEHDRKIFARLNNNDASKTSNGIPKKLQPSSKSPTKRSSRQRHNSFPEQTRKKGLVKRSVSFDSPTKRRNGTSKKKENVETTKSINPFIPSPFHAKIAMTPGRRRWTHAFPINRHGNSIQLHHKPIDLNCQRNYSEDDLANKGLEFTDNYVWGVTGEQSWSAEISTGVDWKALCLPACFPLTTDFLPSNRVLNSCTFSQNDYIYDPRDFILTNEAYSAEQLLKEFTYQRLSHGYQAITVDKQNCRFLSLGETVHKLALDRSENGDKVKITTHKTIARPTNTTISYKYRFQVPDSISYDVSWTDFVCKATDDINWSYLDSYLACKGRSLDYTVDSSMKYWRMRFVLIPPYHYPTSRKIMDELSDTCNIYDTLKDVDCDRMCKTFTDAIESLYQLKRKKNFEKVSRNCPRSNNMLKQSLSVSLTSSELQINCTMDYSMLAAEMKDSATFKAFKSKSCETNFFVVADACDWLKNKVVDVETNEQAMKILQEMYKQKLIGVASPHQESIKVLKMGFCVLYLIDDEKKLINRDFNHFTKIDFCEEEWYFHSFSKNGFEKDVRIPANEPKYVFSRLDCSEIAHGNREEWLHLKHNPNYCPYTAFELEFQSVNCSGATLSDLIGAWHRKSLPVSKKELEPEDWLDTVHIVPIPCDPFALPYTENSDPLRGPIFVPLNIYSICDKQLPLFSDYEPSTRENRLKLFQEKILLSFGFLPIGIHCNQKNQNIQDQYIHASGGMLALIPDMRALPSTTRSDPLPITPRRQSRRFINSSSHNLYIESRMSGEAPGAGFLWAWNYMLNGKWRNKSTGDEVFQDKMLADFRSFCQNANNRLVDFWNDCKCSVKKTGPRRRSFSEPANTVKLKTRPTEPHRDSCQF